MKFAKKHTCQFCKNIIFRETNKLREGLLNTVYTGLVLPEDHVWFKNDPTTFHVVHSHKPSNKPSLCFTKIYWHLWLAATDVMLLLIGYYRITVEPAEGKERKFPKQMLPRMLSISSYKFCPSVQNSLHNSCTGKRQKKTTQKQSTNDYTEPSSL